MLVLRQDTEGELTVNIQANDPSGIFTIPSTVTFADTEATANLHITYDFADIEGNVRYPISLKIDEKDATLYGDASTSFVVLTLPGSQSASASTPMLTYLRCIMSRRFRPIWWRLKKA